MCASTPRLILDLLRPGLLSPPSFVDVTRRDASSKQSRGTCGPAAISTTSTALYVSQGVEDLKGRPCHGDYCLHPSGRL